MRLLVVGVLVLGSLTACTSHVTSPPALPEQRVAWPNTEPFVLTNPPPEPPPAPVPVSVVPEQWDLWRPAPVTRCRGKGKARRCTQVAMN